MRDRTSVASGRLSPCSLAAVMLAPLMLFAAAGCTSNGPAAVAAPAETAPGASSPAVAGSRGAAPATASPLARGGKTPVLKPVPKPVPKPVSVASIAVQVGVSGGALTAVPLDSPVAISVQRGRLTNVTVQSADAALLGSLDDGDTAWTAHGSLAPGATYTVKARAVDAAGLATTKTLKFTTLRPVSVLKTRIAPLNGETVGVGMPVIIYFNHPVTDKAAVEKRLRVTSSSAVEGSWHWLSRSELHYRPRVYWPKGERVRVDVDLAGVNAGKGLWGVQSRSIEFAIGRSHVSLVSAATHTMTVKEDGKVVRTFNVSTGRDEFPTSSGVHVVMSKDAVYWMDSATIGIARKAPGGYYKKVLSSVRISNSGEFVHAAPWSAKDQGLRNVSHGCVNASVADAAWFLRFSRRGDVVNVVGTPRKLELRNGFADWTVPWHTWAEGSALDGE